MKSHSQEERKKRFEAKFFYSEQEMGRKEQILAFIDQEVERAMEEKERSEMPKDNIPKWPEFICDLANHVLYRYEGDTLVYARTKKEWEDLLSDFSPSQINKD